MRPVAIVTDSTHYTPRELTAAAGVHEVSLYVSGEATGGSRRETEITDYDAFYASLRHAAALPTTSQPSIGDFVAAYEPLVAGGSDVVSIHLAGGISGTVGAAAQAKKLLDERVGHGRIAVVDARTACGGLGMVVMAAAAAARAGRGLEDVVAHAQAAREALEIWFCIDTLSYLQRGGRIGRAQAWLGGALQVKPILSLEAEITPVERVRTSARAFERMVDYMRARRDAGADGWVVQHIQAPERAAALIERGRELFGCEPLWVSEVGPVIGTYTGPGLIGVGGLPARMVR